MPTYDYECTDCGHTFEYFQSMSDEVLKDCPQCGGRLRRLVGGGLGVIFKGSGFYVTDNKSGKSAPGSGKTTEAANASLSDSSGASEKSSEKKSSKAESSGHSAPSDTTSSKVSGSGTPGSGRKETVSTV